MPEVRRPSIIVAAGDAGGAAAVLPVIQALSASGRYEVQTVAYAQAATLFAKRRVPFLALQETLSRADAGAWLLERRADLLLCGTSINALELEKRLIDGANDRDIPSLAVLDYWSNYAARFSRHNGDLAHLPCRIAVMDERARAEMIGEGFEPERLVVTGQPAFDDLAASRARFDKVRHREFRESREIGPNQLLVTFFSQPLSQGFRRREDGGAPGDLGYDETTILPQLVKALEEIAGRRECRLVLAIRPHPREPDASYRSLSSLNRSLRILVSTEGESRDWAMASDLVTGMTTMLLVEACYLGCLVVSLQASLKCSDVLPTNRLGLSHAVYREDDVPDAIERMLFDDEVRRAFRSRLEGLHRDEGATRRVVALIDRMLGSSID